VTKVGALCAAIEANFVSGLFRLDFEKRAIAAYRILIKNLRLQKSRLEGRLSDV
jgi:hypothetical protein